MCPVNTPMVTSRKLSKNDNFPEVDQTMYRSMIKSIFYLTTSRPHIMQVVALLGICKSAPKESLLNAVKRIFRYLQGTANNDIWYPQGTNINLKYYTNEYWEGIVDEKKSTSGGAFFIEKYLVS